MTDFFGAVASVEVMGKEGELPLLGRKVGIWEEVKRAKGIESGNGRVNWDPPSLSHTDSAMTGGPGWTGPVAKEETFLRSLRGAVAVAVLALCAYAWMGSDREVTKTD